MDPITALKDSPAFQGFSPEQLDRLGELVLVRDYARDATVFQQGDEAFGLCIIMDGTIALQEKVAGRLVELATLGPGDLVGWSGLVPPHTFTGSGVALSKTKVAIVKMEDLRRMLDDDVHAGYIFERNLAELISMRFHETQALLARNIVGW